MHNFSLPSIYIAQIGSNYNKNSIALSKHYNKTTETILKLLIAGQDSRLGSLIHAHGALFSQQSHSCPAKSNHATCASISNSPNVIVAFVLLIIRIHNY